MSFSAGSVTSGARTQHNFSTTRVRTTCLCHVPRSSSSSVPNTPVSLTHARRRISSKRHDHIRQLRVASSVPSGRDGGRSDARTRSRKLQTQRLRRQLPRRRKPRKGEGRGVAASSDALDDHITSAIARLTLQSRSNTECGPTDSAITTTMREAGVRYHNEVQAADSTPREQSGPPHVHVFGAMITSLVSQITQITPQPTFIDQLGQISRWLNAATLTAVMEVVTVARLSRTRPPNQTRVQIRVNNETHAGAIKAALCTVGLRHVCGTAPPGHHERVLSTHLSRQAALT